ncbi:MAG TPA: ferrochelatase [Vicinamibacteria bacterium]
MSRGVLLLAHGTPDSLDDMPEYLTRVREGRPPSPQLLDEMRRNYAAIGGRSPLTEITLAQAAALERELADGTRVTVGMRNWRPFIADALAALSADAITDVVALPLAPQFSGVSVGKYQAAVEAAAPPGMAVRFVSSWHDHPGLIESLAENLRRALESGPWDAVIFTAHSIPVRLAREGDPYPDEVRATATAVARAANVERWQLAYQSAGRTPEPWLTPSLEQAIDGLAGTGATRVLAAPVGFVSDHTEVLFDIDVQARAFARERGVELGRTESLNTSPVLIRALADIVIEQGGAEPRPPGTPAPSRE